MTILIKNASIYSEDNLIPNGYILLKDGLIQQFGSMNELPDGGHANIIDLENSASVLPGFIDVHIHGAGGADTMDSTRAALQTIARKVVEEGTTSFLATTITQSEDLTEKAVRNVHEYMNAPKEGPEAEILGIHLEGPFINKIKKGAQPEKYILQPSVDKFNQWQEASGNNIRLVTLAPEVEGGLELIQHLSSNGVIASLGHSAATVEHVKQAVEAGATHVTHLFNGMSGMDHREPGLASAAMIFPELNAELICDGIHVHPSMIKLAIQAKGTDKIIFVTDAMCAKGLEDGFYSLGGQTVIVKDGAARIESGSLAGSVLLMSEAVRNATTFSGLPLEVVSQFASTNPAKELGIYDKKGSISVGKDADITIMDKDYNVLMTICKGEIAYRKESL